MHHQASQSSVSLSSVELSLLQAGGWGQGWGTEPPPQSSGRHGVRGYPDEPRGAAWCPGVLPQPPCAQRSGWGPTSCTPHELLGGLWESKGALG